MPFLPVAFFSSSRKPPRFLHPGLANPGPIVSALWSDAELESRISLDGVVTVVDALNIDRQLHEPRPEGAVNEAQLQIAYADIVVLNKVRGLAGGVG